MLRDEGVKAKNGWWKWRKKNWQLTNERKINYCGGAARIHCSYPPVNAADTVAFIK